MTRNAIGAPSLPPADARGEPYRLFGSAEKSARLGDAFLMLVLGHRIRHDPGTGLDVHPAVLDDRSAEHDAGVHRPIGREIADAAGVDAALLDLQLVDDLHRADLWRARHRACRKARCEGVERVM